ncbi:M16 family metallopeptidase [Kitasatospora sp. LaBMicrA B282]|uniref:M16 family metallopeptidase n=1 Tax=Kitasatospora sp. LaBMicrA B282 TaxID=3420949 RepID=UPI003D0CB763
MSRILWPEGVPVLVDHQPHLRTTSLCVALGHGARHDPDTASGATHLLEHLVMSVPLDDGRSLCERIEQLGGTCNAATGPESLMIHAQVLNEDAEQVVGWVCEALLRPQLTAQALDAERRVVLQELATAESDPADTVQDAFLASLFAGHPLGSPVGGCPETVSRITVEQLARAHTTALATAPLAVAVVGGVQPARVAAALTAGGLRDLPAVPLRDPAADRPGPVTGELVEAWPEEFCWLLVGGRAPHAGDPRRHAYDVLAHLLGASPASLLYARIRNDEALAYSFRAWSRNYGDTGAWRMLAGVEAASAPRVLTVFREVLAEVAAGKAAPEAFAAAVRQAVMELVLLAEAPLDHAIALAGSRIHVDRPWDVDAEIALLQQVTPDQVATAAAELSAGLVATVRPEAS